MSSLPTPEFELGDKVRITGCADGYVTNKGYLGKTGTIVRLPVPGDNLYTVEFSKDVKDGILSDEMTLIPSKPFDPRECV